MVNHGTGLKDSRCLTRTNLTFLHALPVALSCLLAFLTSQQLRFRRCWTLIHFHGFKHRFLRLQHNLCRAPTCHMFESAYFWDLIVDISEKGTTTAPWFGVPIPRFHCDVCHGGGNKKSTSSTALSIVPEVQISVGKLEHNFRNFSTCI